MHLLTQIESAKNRELAQKALDIEAERRELARLEFKAQQQEEEAKQIKHEDVVQIREAWDAQLQLKDVTRKIEHMF